MGLDRDQEDESRDINTVLGVVVRPLILRHSLSLDGIAAAPAGVRDDFFLEYDEDAEFVAHMATVLGSAGVHAMGSRTYRDMTGYWPFQRGPEADAMNTIPKAVFSRSPIEDPWATTTICSGDLATEVARLKAQDDGSILAHERRAVRPGARPRGPRRRVPPAGQPLRPRRRQPAVHRAHQAAADRRQVIPQGQTSH
ncbi:dihydrofolate reductase family protein [Promicromonospora kroppenstedtii]|uniref:dihydrofolate reductase family protein n=1 Tax=Promicromonospora kroppenstedtii TaxID=440482 RepID=UPI0004BC4DC3|nr:hypothetical protein [Promicromonospora kroppenstedtii]